MHTTLAKLKAEGACQGRYRHLCKALGGARAYGKDTPLPYARILELNGLLDCLWSLEHGDAEALHVCRLAALAFAQRAERYTDDARIKDCNRVRHLYLHGEATEEEWDAARSAAREAWDAARDAASDAWAVERRAQNEILRGILTAVCHE